MTKNRISQTKHSCDWTQVSAFRLFSHHLIDRSSADLVAVCGDVCGIQAQVMNAGRLALRARMDNLKRNAIDIALYESRSLIKTLLMRQTVHLVPHDDFSIYVTAVKRSRVAAIRRIMSRFNISDNDVKRLNDAVIDALSAGPMTQRELTDRVKPKMGKGVKRWMDLVWNPFRLSLVEGLICYGPNRGNEVTFVRVDQWLPAARIIEEGEAKRILSRRFLSAYGPATVRDFSHWSGIPVKEAAPVWESLTKEFLEVSVEGQRASILRKDHQKLIKANLSEQLVNLLPGFDPYLLAHAEKEHLVSREHYKRIYRKQGWISPVVLLNGKAIGIWSVTTRGKAASLKIELFEKISKKTRDKIGEEAERVGAFLEASLKVVML